MKFFAQVFMILYCLVSGALLLTDTVVIQQQQKLIREMTNNPACMVDPHGLPKKK